MPTKLCPMCHGVNIADEGECDCGYKFGQDIDKVLKLLRAQRTSAWIVFGCVLALDLIVLGGVVFLAARGILLYSLFVFIPLMIWTGRAARKILLTRTSMRQLEKRGLPKATLRKE